MWVFLGVREYLSQHELRKISQTLFNENFKNGQPPM